MQRRFSPYCRIASFFVFVFGSLCSFQALAADDAATDPPPAIELLVPIAGSMVRELETVEIHFDAPVQGLDAADLLINGVGATNVTEFGLGQFVFSFTQPPDGAVTVSWRPDHGITGRTEAPRAFAGGSWTYQLDSASPAPDVYISEFMADNNRRLNDEDGDNSDWIEIVNSGDTTASLNGWFLTDDPNNLVKWRFPDIALPPNEFLLVFASEKNKTNTPGRLHTNFKLSPTGEYLALVSPATNVVSGFAPQYPKQVTDVSYGRVLGAPHAVGYFTQPTPAARNAASGPGFGAEVQFSQTSRTFTAPFELTLSGAASNAVIRYTLDGNLPTNASPTFLAPIRITNSVQVRARTFQEGLLPGPPRTETFLLLSNNVVNFTSDLPVVIIHSLGKGAPTASRQNFAHISVYEPVNGVTSLTNKPALVTRSGVKIRGSSTEGLPKASWAVEFWDEFNLDKKQELLGLPEESDWVFYAPNVYDPVLIHNPFIHQLSRDLGEYSSRWRFVEVYLNRGTGPIAATNYNGIYVIEEKIKIGKNRVDIDKLEPEHLRPPEITGGYLLKIDRVDPGDGGFTAGGQTMAFVDPKEPVIELPQRDPQEQYIKSYFNAFNRALSGTNWLHPTLGYAAYLDVNQWVDFHIVEVLSGNVDAIVLSTYLYKPRAGKIVFGPHWDFDRALGSTDGRDSNPRTWNTGPFFSSWFNRLFRDPDAWQRWIDRYDALRRTHLSLTNMHGLIDRLASEVRQAQPRDRARWRTAMRGGSYQGEVNLMKNWVSNRVEFIDRQFVRPPILSAQGGRVTPGFKLSIGAATNATIFYTLDGTDPRLPQGAPSPAARIYAEPLTLIENARVVARARNLSQRQPGGPPSSSPWSGPVAATFAVAPPPLLLTEFMFHPEPAFRSGTNAAAEFEFLELKNVGSASLNLIGFRLTNGVEFAFTSASSVTQLAPGERVLLVKNQAAFLSRYPGATRVAGEFTGTLANKANRLTMVGPVLEPIFDFKYDDGWQPLADGFGFSLTLADEHTPTEKLGESASWRLSSKVGGSPGATDPVPVSLPAVLVNELLPNPGAAQKESIELWNPGAQPADVGGWFLTDDFRAPKKFRLPGRTIPANGLLVLEDLSSAPGSTLAFRKLGEEVYLFSADTAGNLTGWFHGFEFGASAQGASFGRFVNSAGEERFVAQTKVTLGEANAGPRVGPVVISEIMYAPAPIGPDNNTADEFVELRNTSTQPVPLYDPARPVHTWRLRGAVDFDFPTNRTLNANSSLVLVGFDPRRDALALAAFRSRYGLDAAAVILGPWRGNLNNSGDTVRVLKPGEPDSADTPAPYLLVEQVAYSNGRPWPEGAAGTGRSLARREAGAFGDDPANWLTAWPSAGDADTDGDGMPDRWEIAHGLDPKSSRNDDGPSHDPDGDGFTNFQEFMSGTLPRDPGSFLRLKFQRSAGGGTQVTFTAIPDRHYTIQYRDDFTLSRWRTWRVLVAPPTGGEVTVTDAVPVVTRFYRLTTP